jgi:selenocysteine-specific elongation factor
MSPQPPGFLRSSEDADVLLMIGTAGHVDHGKTRLIRLLTGCETDRLKAEKERGLSIELGFAPCRLGQGLSAGIVDVPGHEQFIKNMVAGAAGMDLTVLVVAADDGVMPQTVEHLQIMEFLGVQRGLVALTKIDLVSRERVEEVQTQIRKLIQNTFLHEAGICPVSSETLEGFDVFYQALVALAMDSLIERREGVFRLPVERVFSPPGFGTVATGIPQAGEVAEGEEVEIQPGGRRVRVRGIQRFLRNARAGKAGQCLALNLAGLPKEALSRGMVIARPGFVQPVETVQAVIRTTHNLDPPVRDGEEMKLHVGTSEIPGRGILYAGEVLERSVSGFVSIRLSEPVVVVPGDRFVLRRQSPSTTIAGGVVLEVFPEKPPRRPKKEWAKRLEQLWQSWSSPAARLEQMIVLAGWGGFSLKEAMRSLQLEEKQIRRLLEPILKSGRVHPAGPDVWVHEAALDAGAERLKKILNRKRENTLKSAGVSVAEAARTLHCSPEAVLLFAGRLETLGDFALEEDRIVPQKKFSDGHDPEDQLRQQIENIYRQEGFATPRPEELPERFEADESEVKSVLDELCRRKVLVRIGKNVVFHRQWMEEAERRVREEILTNGQLDSGDFKKTIESTRKYALAILDYFDTIHITQRFGNARKLHPAYLRKHPELGKKG